MYYFQVSLYSNEILQRKYKGTERNGFYSEFEIYWKRRQCTPSMRGAESADIYKTEDNSGAAGTCSYDDSGFVVEMMNSFGEISQIDTYDQQYQLIHVQSFFSGRETETTESI